MDVSDVVSAISASAEEIAYVGAAVLFLLGVRYIFRNLRYVM